MRSTSLLLTLFILVSFTFLPIVHADRGGFSPISERVSESGQKAIIAWNGTHEILILSTDVSSSNESEVIELMPLPSNPTISKGEKQSFLKIEQLVNTYLAVTSSRRTYTSLWHLGIEQAPKITITFQEVIGVHYLTVVKAEEASDLIWWLEDFLEAGGYSKELPSNLEELFSYYMQNGMSFFVIDVIEANSTVKTVDTLVYEFRSPNLYYPLQISILFSGDTEISLFTITSNELNDNLVIKEGFVKKAQFQIKQEALPEISTNLTKLFSGNPYLCYFHFKGSLESFDGDILADFQSALNISTITIASLSLCLGLVFLFLTTNKIGFHLRNVHMSMTRKLEITSLFAGLVGISLTLSGFFLPLGLIGFGKNGEVLITISGVYVASFAVSKLVDLLFSLFLLATIYCYVYLLIHRNSKGASLILAIGGAYMMSHVLISSAYLYTVGIGIYAILIGYSFIISAGLLSLRRIKLTPRAL